MKLPAATYREYGQEYCGVIYSPGDGLHYASNPSPLGKRELAGPSKRKTCYVPVSVKDPRGRASVTADYHSHPWSFSPMSDEDRKRDTQWYSIRIQFDVACHVQKLIPYPGDARPGELYERQGRQWKLIGHILPEDKDSGQITPVRGGPLP
jgi:hypothetical protein